MKQAAPQVGRLGAGFLQFLTPAVRRVGAGRDPHTARNALCLLVAIWLADGANLQAATPSLAVKADRVHIGDGRVINDGIIVIQDGRISAIGNDIDFPEDTPVIETQGGHLTPGLIDANARIASVDLIAASRRWPSQHVTDPSDGTGDGDSPPPLVSGVRSSAVINEQSSEVVPHIRVLDALDFRSRDFDRLLRGGVTTVYASPDASAVVGARGTIVRTGGPRSGRVLAATAAVKATIGSDPSRLGTYNRSPSRNSATMYARRPNSRMGLVWVFRKAFYDAARRRDGFAAYGADTACAEAHAVLQDVMEGEVPLRIQARIQQDILAALRLADEFDLKFTLEEATEAYLCVEELKAASVDVIFGPIYDRPTGIRVRSGEGNQSRYYTLRALLEAGIPTALSAQELREEDGLARQAMYAQRFGVTYDDALRAVTQTPAQLLGIADQVGSLDVGKRADIVLWNGRPFAATSMPLVVLIDGQLVLDHR